jgi:hypothetical protein
MTLSPEVEKFDKHLDTTVDLKLTSYTAVADKVFELFRFCTHEKLRHHSGFDNLVYDLYGPANSDFQGTESQKEFVKRGLYIFRLGMNTLTDDEFMSRLYSSYRNLITVYQSRTHCGRYVRRIGAKKNAAAHRQVIAEAIVKNLYRRATPYGRSYIEAVVDSLTTPLSIEQKEYA